MPKKLTMTVDAEIHDGLHRIIGRRRISRFLNDLARMSLVRTSTRATPPWPRTTNTKPRRRHGARDWLAMSPTNHIAMADEAPQRGDIWIVQRGPSIGGEIQRTRPAVILSDDIANGLLRRVGRLPDEDMVAVGRVVGMHLGL